MLPNTLIKTSFMLHSSLEYKDILYLQLQKNIYLDLLDLDAYNEANTFVRFKLTQQ